MLGVGVASSLGVGSGVGVFSGVGVAVIAGGVGVAEFCMSAGASPENNPIIAIIMMTRSIAAIANTPYALNCLFLMRES